MTSFRRKILSAFFYIVPEDKRHYIPPKCCLDPGDPSDKFHVGFTECVLPILQVLFC